MTKEKKEVLLSRVEYGAAKYADKAAKKLLKETPALTDDDLCTIVCYARSKNLARNAWLKLRTRELSQDILVKINELAFDNLATAAYMTLELKTLNGLGA